MATTPVFLQKNPQGPGGLVGCTSLHGVAQVGQPGDSAAAAALLSEHQAAPDVWALCIDLSFPA